MTNRFEASGYDRRKFLASTAALGTGALGLVDRDVLAADPPNSSQVVTGKNAQLVVHTSTIPQLETPPALLDSQITPLDVLFVRNNQPLANVATLKPFPSKGWKISLTGRVDKPRSLNAERLAGMEQVEHEMVLQCCGNGRSLFASSVKAKGTQWTRGGMGNIRVSGVRLSELVRKLGVRIGRKARFLTVEGKDIPLPDKEDFEHSLPLDEAMEHSLLATRINGQPIPAVHGGPVRLMTPGYYGTMHVKWVSRLRFEDDETDNYNHIPRYRVPRERLQPGKPIKYTFSNSKACWRMKTKCVVLSPQPDAAVRAGKPLEVRGVAFNDGSTRIDSVQLSTDGGQTWSRVRLNIPSGPFAWYRWSATVTLPAGKRQLWARTVDALGRTQPLDGSIHWNPSGYEWNGVEKIAVTAS
ncbi:MAG: sulfite oxidase [Planctomycetaceae bacterium]|jgi:DMSO/TMAO reductase YedYZ molybdopterin-dependent catalytic subunit|nr:sulfite oxidase [Planctomycetaceae bacterium]